jgi:hypothetical protein
MFARKCFAVEGCSPWGVQAGLLFGAPLPNPNGSPAQRLDFISRDLSEQRQHDPGCRIPLGVFWTEKAVDNAPARLYSLLPFAIHPAINVGLWLSLVERFVRVEEVESSNLSSPTTYFAWPKYVPLSSFLRCPTQPPAPH